MSEKGAGFIKAGGEEIIISVESAASRCDVFLSGALPGRTRSYVRTLFDKDCVCVNGRPGKPADKLREGDCVSVFIPEPAVMSACPQDIPIEIVYEDDMLAVINKPKGMVVHPAAGNPDGTLVNALMFKLGGLSGINGELRPGIVHRLDKDTSGLMAVAKNDEAHRSLSEQIANKTARRIYLAIVHGNVREDKGVVDAPIGRHKTQRKQFAVTPGGRPSKTRYRVLERFGSYTLIECELETGRTHQIRVHMKHAGHPVAGDPVYGPKEVKLTGDGQLLHAYKLKFVHPGTGEAMEFSVSAPESFIRVLEKLRKK